MELTKIKGNSYYINFPTNIGVYIFKNKNCLLIDTGKNKYDGKKIEEILLENGLHPKYIVNTHSHLDHCGGNLLFKENYPGCLTYTSFKEKLFMENHDLNAAMLFSASPIKLIYKSNKNISVDYILDYGINKINDEKFEVISLKGHSPEQIGFITPEKVCFLGDSIFSDETIKKYSLPYYYDLEDSIKSLEIIKNIVADYFVISHCDRVLEKNEIINLADKNMKNIKKHINIILELLDQPLTKEDILENLVILEDLKLNFNQYHLYTGALSAFIAYLFHKNLIDYSIEDGKLYYFKKL
ncbi:MBL fold metallo-hydrolase [Clostridium sporogenes]|uniref:MBL fold metallo-hydrolase n=3 Tax=Clostridium TaxID=1485 RepID=A0A7X5P6H4_CLOSG|nr:MULTISPECIES: MBL fold metallo-hydrolase [Clostridium]AJD32769.1 metallo-beta-lactamase superfamily protein [Clostridium botulinum Prevot_594]AVP59998.1 MBL fold metallo-hydrolase [Clostridium botulinum]AKC63659.1 metallo-beta-lactamase family protein [Clostridium sporogenes]AKJ90815.1 hydrolase [Clostridium sporogenes]AVP65849.1 MBL fold metallo-hydrolase [Clostridium botulinum]